MKIFRVFIKFIEVFRLTSLGEERVLRIANEFARLTSLKLLRTHSLIQWVLIDPFLDILKNLPRRICSFWRCWLGPYYS